MASVPQPALISTALGGLLPSLCLAFAAALAHPRLPVGPVLTGGVSFLLVWGPELLGGWHRTFPGERHLPPGKLPVSALRLCPVFFPRSQEGSRWNGGGFLPSVVFGGEGRPGDGL